MNKILTCRLVVLMVLLGAQETIQSSTRASCPGDYSPCECSQNGPIPDGSARIVCIRVSVQDVQRIFSTTTELNIDELKWTLPLENPIVMPANLIADKRIWIFNFECLNSNQLVIDPDAFRSSSEVTFQFTVKGCDFRQQFDYGFLNRFNNLSSIHLDSMANVPSIIHFPPSLPLLYYLEVYLTSGLEEPSSATVKLNYPSLQTIDLIKDELSDRAVNQILDAIYPSAAKSLEELNLGSNKLTRLPTQVPNLFPKMTALNLNGNNITQLESGSVVFSGNVKSFFVGNNGLTYIAPGTFKGNYTGSTVGLYSNGLTTFEASVFKEMLEQMVLLPPYGSRLDVYSNPIDCDGCGLAWLIRDNRDLLSPVNKTECANMTLFEELDPNGYNDCPPTKL